MDVVISLLAFAAVVLAVATLVQGNRGNLVFEPRDGRYRTRESIRAESRWAALEYVGGAVTLVGLLTNFLPLSLLGLAAAVTGYVRVMTARKRND
ncbi:MAG TPA: hypothetical protein VFL59_10245 [Candidatus Nanopelagicales bacterium]|nr:hypothetical protein [Candidatus Nanopelagicales bacterium]